MLQQHVPLAGMCSRSTALPLQLRHGLASTRGRGMQELEQRLLSTLVQNEASRQTGDVKPRLPTRLAWERGTCPDHTSRTPAGLLPGCPERWISTHGGGARTTCRITGFEQAVAGSSAERARAAILP